MKKILYTGMILAGASLLNGSSSFAQDARFAQSFANPLRLNPAIMGANRDIFVGANYRSQWTAADGGYKTFCFTGMYPVVAKNGNDKFDAGISVMNDKAGAFKTTDIAIALNYTKELAPHNDISLSILGGFVQKSLNLNDQTFDSQYMNGAFNASASNGEMQINNKISHPDVGFGLMWYYNPERTDSKINAYVGVSGFHLNQPNESFMTTSAKLPIRFSYQAGIKIFSTKKLDVSPNIRVNNQAGNIEPAVGLYLDYHLNANFKFVFGTWYRAHDASCILVGFDHKNYTLGYSYDLISSGLNNATNDIRANEITLSIKLSPPGRKNTVLTGKEKIDDNGVPIISNTYTSPFSSF